MAFAVPSTGARTSIAHRVAHWINSLGHGKVILKADQEPSKVDLQKVSREERLRAYGEKSKHVRIIRGMDDEDDGGVGPGQSLVGEF